MSATASIQSEQAVIYVGAASVSLVIGRPDESGQFNCEVESLDRPLPVARDIFRTRSISRAAPSIRRRPSCAITSRAIARVRHALEAIRLFTYNILSEASNHEIFLNRLQVTQRLSLPASSTTAT
jgi:exopolyphosphatase/guanosine-5'-triphosphate,3'-diphosphate pyrophosphatase